MTSKYVDALDQAKSTIKRQFVLIVALVFITGLAMMGWKDAPRDLTVHVPPDLRNGAKLKVGPHSEVPDTSVYTFAINIWQQLNYWAGDGSTDYGKQILYLQNYLTPACREQIISDMNQRSGAGELFKRTRAVMEIPGLGFTEKRVVVLGANSWQVLLDTQVKETQNGVSIKDTFIRYPLRIVRFDVHRDLNPWQLAIDCFGDERPARLDAQAVAVAQAGRTVVAVRESRSTPNAVVKPVQQTDLLPQNASAPHPAASSGGPLPSTEPGTSVTPVSLPKPF